MEIIVKNIFVIHVSVGLSGGVLSVIKNLIIEQKQTLDKIGILYTNGDELIFNDPIFDDVEKIRYNTRFHFTGARLLFGIPLKKIYLQYKKKYPENKIVFHIHNVSAVGLINSIKEVPIVCSIHGLVCGGRISKVLSNIIMKKMLINNNILVGVSNKTAEYYNNILHTDKIVVVQNGVKAERDICKIKKASTELFSVGFISYLDDLKGWKYVVDAYNSLSIQYRKHIKLHLVGEIEESNQIVLKNKLKKCPETQIEYYGKIEKAGSTVIPYIDVIVLPSSSEGIPMCLLEAIGHGKIILATAVGGIPEILLDNYNGKIVERNAEDIKEKIVWLYKNPDQQIRMKENAQKLYKEKFNSKIMYEKYHNLYLMTLEGKI